MRPILVTGAGGAGGPAPLAVLASTAPKTDLGYTPERRSAQASDLCRRNAGL